MIVYGTYEEIDALKDFFINLNNTELARIVKVKFSEVKTVSLDKELLYEMERNIKS